MKYFFVLSCVFLSLHGDGSQFDSSQVTPNCDMPQVVISKDNFNAIAQAAERHALLLAQFEKLRESQEELKEEICGVGVRTENEMMQLKQMLRENNQLILVVGQAITGNQQRMLDRMQYLTNAAMGVGVGIGIVATYFAAHFLLQADLNALLDGSST